MALCKICIHHIPVGYAGGTTHGWGGRATDGAVAERFRTAGAPQALAVA
ncbi:MAG: hypothetical protein Q7U66_16375 [Methylobacter sp.]|nr:hypothetical protein [Methylobacter sp.]